jgi:hypothetical protein
MQLLFKFTVAVAQPQCPAAVTVTAIVRTVRRALFIFEEIIRVTEAREGMFFSPVSRDTPAGISLECRIKWPIIRTESM